MSPKKYNLSITLKDALNKGIRAHKNKKYEEANEYYTIILKKFPKHADANHNMGVLAFELGEIQEAISYFKIALHENENATQYWISLINALIVNKNFSEAEACIGQARKMGLENNLAEVLKARLKKIATSQSNEPRREEINVLLINLKNNEYDRAIRQAEKLLTLYPESIQILNILGAANTALNNSSSAIKYLERVAALAPDFAEVFFNLGNLYGDLAESEKAINYYKIAISKKDKYPKALNNLGLIFKQKKLFEDAIKCFSDAVVQDPTYAIAFNNLGNLYYDLGEFDAAIANYKKAIISDTNYFEAYNNLALVLKNKNNWVEAQQNFEKAIKINPAYAEAHCNLGIVFSSINKSSNAIECYEQAIKFNPNLISAWINLAILRREQGLNDEAKRTYERALIQNPHNAILHNNLGSIQHEDGEIINAERSYTAALKYDPNHVEALNNIGIIYFHADKIHEAIEKYQQALNLRPEYYNALCNLALAHKQEDDVGSALELIDKAISIQPDRVDAFVNLGAILRGAHFKYPNKKFHDVILKLLSKTSLVRPIDIAPCIVSLIKAEPKFKELVSIDIKAADWESTRGLIHDLAHFSLLLRLMELCPIPDVQIENLLITLRSKLLEYKDLIDNDELVLEFQSALALQCFTNEYVYKISNNNRCLLEKLTRECAEYIANEKQPSCQAILCIASFKALHMFKWSNKLIATKNLSSIINRQVLEPHDEEMHKSTIESLADVSNQTSSIVREQYEQNPYPRWINTQLVSQPQSVSKIVTQLKLKATKSVPVSGIGPKILVAGCGTGQHALGTATRFKSSEIIALDLSLSSLAYAKRKSSELGVTNITYLQGDILDLANSDMMFDVIESVGVLHHMSEPSKGWRVLCERLKTGGIMKIGLYSSTARKHISYVRDALISQNVANPEDIIAHREVLKASENPHHLKLHQSKDFYSLSTIRDLIFHVQEHQFTIPQISELLTDLDLEFCGFENDEITSLFRKNKGDLYDLKAWESFENENPWIFSSMYQFWCQKA